MLSTVQCSSSLLDLSLRALLFSTSYSVNHHHVFKLEIQLKKSGLQEKYNLDDLFDLQCKLMLIAGEAEAGWSDVSNFVAILEIVRHVAETFVKLVHAGCMLFNKWSALIRYASSCAKYWNSLALSRSGFWTTGVTLEITWCHVVHRCWVLRYQLGRNCCNLALVGLSIPAVAFFRINIVGVFQENCKIKHVPWLKNIYLKQSYPLDAAVPDCLSIFVKDLTDSIVGWG